MAAYLPKRWPQRRRWRSFTSSDERSKKTAHLLGRHLEVASKLFPCHLRPATFLSFPMSPQFLPTYESSLVVSLYKKESRTRRIEEFRRSPRVACPPSFSRVQMYFARPITLAEIRGYSQCWTVTLLLASLADTIAFYFNKFIILCVMCNYVPDWIRKKNFQNYVEKYCSSHAGAPGPEQRKLVKILIFRCYSLPLQLMI